MYIGGLVSGVAQTGWLSRMWINKKNSLQWRHNEHHGVSIHQQLKCWFSRLFRLTSNKYPSPRYSPFCEGSHRSTVVRWIPHKWSVTRKVFTCNDVIMCQIILDTVRQISRIFDTKFLYIKSDPSLKVSLFFTLFFNSHELTFWTIPMIFLLKHDPLQDDTIYNIASTNIEHRYDLD